MLTNLDLEKLRLALNGLPPVKGMSSKHKIALLRNKRMIEKAWEEYSQLRKDLVLDVTDDPTKPVPPDHPRYVELQNSIEELLNEEVELDLIQVPAEAYNLDQNEGITLGLMDILEPITDFLAEDDG